MCRGQAGTLAPFLAKMVQNKLVGEEGMGPALLFERVISSLPELTYIVKQSSKNEALFFGHIISAMSPIQGPWGYQIIASPR